MIFNLLNLPSAHKPIPIIGILQRFNKFAESCFGNKFCSYYQKKFKNSKLHLFQPTLAQMFALSFIMLSTLFREKDTHLEFTVNRLLKPSATLFKLIEIDLNVIPKIQTTEQDYYTVWQTSMPNTCKASI